jgi:hypothetical protein
MLDDGLVARFKVSFVEGGPDECWVWQRSVAGEGYGQIKLTKERRQTYAHRVAYELAYGELPQGKQVCHSCDNPPCVNPRHLFVGSSHDNHQDMKRKGRHLFGEKNGNSVLTEQKVREILALLPFVPQWDLATRYGVAPITISRISRGLRWAHLRR